MGPTFLKDSARHHLVCGARRDAASCRTLPRALPGHQYGQRRLRYAFSSSKLDQTQLKQRHQCRCSNKGVPSSLQSDKGTPEQQQAAVPTSSGQDRNIGTLIAWVAAAAAFGAGIFFTQGPQKAEEYFAGRGQDQGTVICTLGIGYVAKRGVHRLLPVYYLIVDVLVHNVSIFILFWC